MALRADSLNRLDCEIVFVEYLGDLVKLHLTAGGERLLAKVTGDHYPSLRGREGDDRDLLEGRGCPAPRGLSRRRRRASTSASSTRSKSYEHPERSGADPSGEGALGEAGVDRRQGIITLAWAAPGTLWLIFYLLAPVVMIVLVSFWTPSITGFEKSFTLDNYRTLFGSSVYWNQLKDSFFVALIVVGACLVLGFPIAYFLSFKIKSLRNQIALFLVLLAPFLTSYLIRAVAWEYPLMGRQGAINQVLQKIGVISEPLDILGFSRFSVTAALIQLVHPFHDHTALLHALPGRSKLARGCP